MRSGRETFRPKVRFAYSKIASERRLLAAHGGQGIVGPTLSPPLPRLMKSRRKGSRDANSQGGCFRNGQISLVSAGSAFALPDDIRENGTTSLPSIDPGTAVGCSSPALHSPPRGRMPGPPTRPSPSNLR